MYSVLYFFDQMIELVVVKFYQISENFTAATSMFQILPLRSSSLQVKPNKHMQHELQSSMSESATHKCTFSWPLIKC